MIFKLILKLLPVFFLLFLSACNKYKELVAINPNCSIQGKIKKNWFSYEYPNFYRRYKINKKSIYPSQDRIIIFKDSENNINYAYCESDLVLFYRGKKYKSKGSYAEAAYKFIKITKNIKYNSSTYKVKVLNKDIDIKNSEILYISISHLKIRILIFSDLREAINAIFYNEIVHYKELIFNLKKIHNLPKTWPTLK